MANYTINADGSKTIHGRYIKAGVLRLTAIFPKTPELAEKYLPRTKGSGDLQDIYGVHDKTTLVRRIFTTFLMKVLERVAAGDLFMMPGSTQAHIVVKAVPDGEAIYSRKNGRYKGYDIVKAGFRIPSFYLDFGPFSYRKDFRIYVPPPLLNKTLKNAENGVLPWITIPKTYNRDVQYERYDDGDV